MHPVPKADENAARASLPSGPSAEGFDEAAAAALLPDVRAVVAAVLGVGRSHPDADDAANEAMRRALEGRGRLQAGLPVRPWLLGIARHVALDARRSRGRTAARTAPDHTDGSAAVDHVAATRPNPFELLAEARRAAKVRDALATLPEGPRQALTLFHLEGLGYDEITRRLGVPMGTVATWVSRGRKALLGELAAGGMNP
jgi:RNA polymerase sigma-70 factor (ECF subfamily)